MRPVCLRPISAASCLPPAPIMTPHSRRSMTLSGRILSRKARSGRLGGREDPLARRDDFGRQGRVGPALKVTIGKAHVAGAGFGKGEARDAESGFAVPQGMGIFDFDAKHDLTVRVERPGVGELEILFSLNTPDRRQTGGCPFRGGLHPVRRRPPACAPGSGRHGQTRHVAWDPGPGRGGCRGCRSARACWIIQPPDRTVS